MQSKSFKKFKTNIIFQSILFGAFISLVTGLMWDLPIERFNFNFEDNIQGNQDKELLWYCDDFDNDGNSEKLRCGVSSSTNRFSIVAYNHLGKIILSYSLNHDEWNTHLKPSVFDTNNDSVKELVFFSLNKDSIFLNAVDVIHNRQVIDHLFFSTIEKYSENMGVNSLFYGISDYDKDGHRELLFSFDAGYGLYPRGVFKLDLTTMEFIKPEKNYSPAHIGSLTDLTNDKIPELLTTVYSPGNVGFQTKYHDKQSYILAYDINLNPLFPPIPMPGEYSSVHTCPSQSVDSFFYASYTSRSDTIHSNQLLVVSKSGRIIKSKEIPNGNFETERINLNIINQTPYLFIDHYGKYKLTPDLKNIPTKLNQREKKIFHFPNQIIDLDTDQWEEQITFDNRNITIYNERYDYASTIEIPFTTNSFVSIFPFLKEGKIVKYFITSNSSFTYFNYTPNPFYFTVYLLYFFLFLCFSGLIFFLLFFQQKHLEKKWQMEKQLSELQFNSVKNQLNPHFLFNALNSVAYLINNGQKDEAYDFLTVNSRMIQRVMNDAKEIKRSLKDEVQFTKDYLNIQQRRFKERFRSEFIIDPDVDLKLEIPKMCIHTYVENAIKHGFRNTHSGGLLQIKIHSRKNGVLISITDSGMGRKAAKEFKTSSGNGIRIMDEFYRLFEKYYSYKINFNITDLYNHSGTQVILEISYKVG